MEVVFSRPRLLVAAVVLVFFLLVSSSPHPTEAGRGTQGEGGAVPAASLGGVDARRCQLQTGSRKLMQEDDEYLRPTAPLPPSPIPGPPIGDYRVDDKNISSQPSNVLEGETVSSGMPCPSICP